MKRKIWLLAFWTSVVVGIGLLAGCEGGGDSGTSGSAVIEGNVVSFQNTSADAGVSETLMKTADQSGLTVSAAETNVSPGIGGPGGIAVSITGPEDRSTITSPDGTFSFMGLPAGAYGFSFEFNGEEVRYRGSSGQEATIMVQSNQTAELLNIRISGGKINIGNIRIITRD